MDYNLFIENFTENIQNLNQHDFNKHNYIISEKLRVKKEIDENPMIIREFKSAMAQSSAKKIKTENFVDINIKSNINLFDTNNINSFNDDEVIENKTDFYELDSINKLSFIKDYMSRKKIYIEINEFNKINDLLDDNETLKKYVTISKSHNQISKISFFKKREDSSYYIDFIIPKKKNKTIFFK